MVDPSALEIKPANWQWTGRALALLQGLLKVNIRLFGDPGLLADGEIFLFNHFARFETFIPQYLIYRATGAYSRSVAAAELFREDDWFRQYLLGLGAVPTDQPGLLPFLAQEVMRGRKVIVFPEGGMVKDRRVIDARGHYSVYSRSALERRKHHSGAAVVALYVETVKEAVRVASHQGRADLLRRWSRELELPGGVAALQDAAARPTRIVPSNITFYPIRIEDNHLRRFAELFRRGIKPRLREELLIEGNILLRDTDMDIRMATPLQVQDFLGWTDRHLLRRVAAGAGSIASLTGQGGAGASLAGSLWLRRSRRVGLKLRDAYMVSTYAALSVNLSHLASALIFRLLDQGQEEVSLDALRTCLYLTVKHTQGSGVHLHRSLRDPGCYVELARGAGCWGLQQLLETAIARGLVSVAGDRCRFLPTLRRDWDFDAVRLANPLAVYANEVAPLGPVREALTLALAQGAERTPPQLARHRFDDELRRFAWDREMFRKKRHAALNATETATADARPFLLEPQGKATLGVLLVHGFTASPAELRGFGERVRDAGFTALGVRLRGHGTSPWDLAERSREDWFESVRAGFGILADLCQRVCVVGFSTGAALGLRLAAGQPAPLAGLAAVAAPLRLRDRNMAFVPFVHGANRLLRSVSPVGGVLRFHRSDPEHPHINYQHMPIQALYELGRLMAEVEADLPAVRCPLLVVQASRDATVDPTSAQTIFDRCASKRKELVVVPSDRHGILYEDVAGTGQRVLTFLREVASGEPG